jgi:D-arabinose 1-dehydrogenase-like Zn-dependent alcohol dehydrogenase
VAVEREPAKVARLRELGVMVVEAGEDLTSADIVAAAGGPLDAVFDMVCSQATFQLGYDSLGRGGSLVIVGAHRDTLSGLSSIDMIYKEKTVTGARNVNRAEIAASLELVATGRVAVHVGATYPLERLGDAFDAIAANSVFGRILIDVNADAS